MTSPPVKVWRVFPWNPDAREGERYSATWVSTHQGKGRFDLAGNTAGVLYLAETAEHAVAEAIQHLRGQRLEHGDLLIEGRPLALVRVTLADPLRKRIADLCDPELLLRLSVRPDATASRDRRATQQIAATIYAAGHAGLRWWSALSGDWHTVVLFGDRLGDPPAHGAPEALTIDHPALGEAARALGIAITAN